MLCLFLNLEEKLRKKKTFHKVTVMAESLDAVFQGHSKHGNAFCVIFIHFDLENL
jgi:hypothetical protein